MHDTSIWPAVPPSPGPVTDGSYRHRHTFEMLRVEQCTGEGGNGVQFCTGDRARRNAPLVLVEFPDRPLMNDRG